MADDKLDTGTEILQFRAIMGELAMSGPLSVARVARRLGTSPRTLQRRLSTHHLSFRGLAEQVRFDVARTLLAQTTLSVEEVSLRVGYRQPGSFARAFARWSGMQPRQFRKSVVSPSPFDLARNEQK